MKWGVFLLVFLLEEYDVGDLVSTQKKQKCRLFLLQKKVFLTLPLEEIAGYAPVANYFELRSLSSLDKLHLSSAFHALKKEKKRMILTVLTLYLKCWISWYSLVENNRTFQIVRYGDDTISLVQYKKWNSITVCSLSLTSVTLLKNYATQTKRSIFFFKYHVRKFESKARNEQKVSNATPAKTGN